MIVLAQIIKSEEITFNDSTPAPSSPIECTDPSTECIINCLSNNVCENKIIHCPQTGSQICIVNLNGYRAGYYAAIYTHQSPLIFISARNTSTETGYGITIYGHERMGSKLYVYGTGIDDFKASRIYGPVGKGSLLSLKCHCHSIEIYEDWTTEVIIHPMRQEQGAFNGATIKNIFDNSTLNITRNNYDGFNTAYRAPVFLDNCEFAPRFFQNAEWYGHNHGHWTIYSLGYKSFINTVIYATADIAPYGDISSYDIKLVGSNNNGDDKDTVFYQFTLYADQINQPGPNIYAEVTSWGGLWQSNIHAKQANSVNIYCHNSGDCTSLMVECPENNGNNSCKIYCDALSDCSNMKIYTTSGYCQDTAVLCHPGTDCTFDAGVCVEPTA